MKKVTIILLSLLLITSCQSTSKKEMLTAEQAEITEEALISAMKAALVSNENTLFTSTIDYTVDSSYQPYLRDLPQFRQTYSEYLAAATALLHSALRPVTDNIVSHLDTFSISDPQSYLDRGYSSLSSELEAELYDETKAIFLDYIDENSREMELVYAALQYEADIWRNNLANLSLVGQGEIIGNIVEIDNASLAEFAADQFFTSLAEAEIDARTTGRIL